MLKRQLYLESLTLQFDQPLFPAQYGAPVLLTTASIITDEKGIAQGNPSKHRQTAIASDITDLVFESIKVRLNQLGLHVERIPAEPSTETTQPVEEAR